MADLRSFVRGAITSYLQQHGDSHTHADILRAIRDQSSLLYEHQLVCDALDEVATIEQLGGARRQLERIKHLMQVTSCDRLVTGEGYSSIDAVVELKRDEQMNEAIQSNVKLTFHYERRPSRSEDDIFETEEEQPSSGTHVWYWIDLSRDCGEKERLLTFEVWAVGEGPSVGVPQIMWESNSMDEGEAKINEEAYIRSASMNNRGASGNESEHQEMDDSTDDEPHDRFFVFVNPDIISNFLSWTQLESFDLRTSILFLMTFPFYENEWDIMDFVMEAGFGEARDQALYQDEDINVVIEDGEHNMVSDDSK